MRRRFLVLLAAIAMMVPGFQPAQAAVTATIVNGDSGGNQVSRYDTDGNSLDVHDGSVIKVGALWYLYGTSYACGYEYQRNSNFCGFKVYTTPDFVNWTDRGYVVPPGNCAYCFRPHVIYNAATQMYVMWSDAGGPYHVYRSPSPTGPFTQQPDPTLSVGGAVDLALFLDDNGDGYVIHNTVQVAAGLTADMVVEKLTPDFLNTNGQSTRAGLGNVEAFTVIKRNGIYHALMSDPTCAYCASTTGEMTATSMLGPWAGAWYDPNGVDWNGAAQPRWRARTVNSTSCGGEPVAALPVVQNDGSTQYWFMSDRWDNRRPNESTANLYIGPMTFDSNNVLQQIACVNSFNATLPGAAGSPNPSPTLDQSSGTSNFRHYCDVAGNLQRRQSFVPTRTGILNSATLTAYGYRTNALLTIEVVDVPTNTVIASKTFSHVPSTAHLLDVKPNVGVQAGRGYVLRMRSATTSGCYGFEYNDNNPYSGGNESYSVNGGSSFTLDAGRDLKFTASVGTTALLGANELPAGYTRCAGEGGTCSFSGTRRVAYGAGSYFFQNVTGSAVCNTGTFGGDPTFGVQKSCYLAPAGGPANYSSACAAEAGYCSFTGYRMVAYGTNGIFDYELARNGKVCGNDAFGDDPLPEVVKSCYLAPVGTPEGGWAACASEGGSCSVASTQTVAYGAQGSFLLRNGSTGCSNSAYGIDPNPGVGKSCYVRTGPPAGYQIACGSEGGTCSFSGFLTVAYGAAGKFIYKSFTNGTPCTVAAFGADPIAGVAKSCYRTQ